MSDNYIGRKRPPANVQESEKLIQDPHSDPDQH